jgi:16S rRNA G1207 methylase RsmC
MDPYFKKEITYTFLRKKLRFDVGETLFSTYAIDHGTDILLRSISTRKTPNSILDLGCGYGPIGIALATAFPKAQVTMVDRDLLAVSFASQNVQRNSLNNAVSVGSVGMDHVEDKYFDLIVSNIPAKIGDDAITQEFILKPYDHLNAGGELWFVVVNALNRLIPKVATKNNLHLVKVRNRAGHTVYKILK